MANERDAGRRNADQVRSDIDHGRTGDKVNYPDPAVAPLGTDAEAGAAQHAMRQDVGERQFVVTQQTPALLEGGPAYILVTAIIVALLVVMYYAISNLR